MPPGSFRQHFQRFLQCKIRPATERAFIDVAQLCRAEKMPCSASSTALFIALSA